MVPVTDSSKSQTCLEWAMDKMKINVGGTGSANMQAQLLEFMKVFRGLECSSCKELVAFQHKRTGAIYCVKKVSEGHDHCYDKMMEASHFDFEMPVANIRYPVMTNNALNSVSLESQKTSDVAPVVRAISSGSQKSAPTPMAPKAVVNTGSDVIDAAPARAPDVHLWSTCPFSQNLANGALVEVQYQYSPTVFHVVAVDDLEDLTKFQAVLAEYVKKGKRLAARPVLGQMVVGSYLEEYYRGRVTKIDGDNCTVTFVDYGDANICPFSELIKVDDTIMKYPIYGMIVKLANVPTAPADFQPDYKLVSVLEEHLSLELLCPEGGLAPGKERNAINVRLWNSARDYCVNEEMIRAIKKASS